MKKNELINELSVTSGLKKKDVEKVMEALNDVLLSAIADNDSVKIGNVVTIRGVDRPARTVNNPRTGEKITVPARTGYPKATFTKVAKE